jgi:hypothetical protein
MKSTLFAMLLCACAASAAAAAPIYRCGPGGRVFSQVPCEGGQLVEAADPRTAAQRAEARRVAALERQRAVEMARERRANGATLAAADKAQAAPPAASEPERGKRHRKVKTGPVKPMEPAGRRTGKRKPVG